jgi:hypothetical protein
MDGFIDVNNGLRFGDAPTTDSIDWGAETWAKNELGVTDAEWDEWQHEYVDNFMGLMVNNLDSAIAKSSVPQDMITYRGWGFGSEVGSLSVGETFTDAGFVSTSASRKFVQKHFSSGEPIAKIHLPKGQNAAFTYPGWFGHQTDEAELTLPSGLTFRVLSKTADEIELEIVND